MKFLQLIFLAFLSILTACSSGKVAFEHGNYYEAVLTSVNRLRKNADHSKSIETLRQAYPLAVSYYEDKAKTALASNAQFKWSAVVDSYTAINVMYDEIRRSPGALKVIPSPSNYYAQLEEARKNAAEECYAAGITAMTFNNRDKAKEAYGHFTRTEGFVPGYKDVIKMKEAALWAATIKVVVEPIPVSKNMSVSAEFFDDKISEYLHQNSINQWVRFFTLKEMQQIKLNPDHFIKLEFDEFAVGQVFLYEKEMKLENDSVVVGSYVAQQNFKQGQTNTGGTGNQNLGSGTGQGQAQNQNSTGQTGTQNPNTDTQNQNTGSQQSSNTGQGTDNQNQNQNQNSNQNQGQNQNTGNNSNSENQNSNQGQNNSQGQGNAGNTGNQGSGNTSAADSIDANQRVTICHIPSGNVAAKHSLVISKSALKAHMAHGDTMGPCEESKDKGKSGGTKQNEKGKSDDKGKGNGTHAWLENAEPIYFASANENFNWLPLMHADTTKIYSTVKATLYYSKKTTTSKGIVSFKIIDAKTNALLAVEKMPGEYIWISEWATFNGDERALTPQQLQWSKQKERVPPPSQDLFMEFTKPIYDQVITKIRNFYKTY